MWCVINFIEANDIEVVPELWVKSETFECWWPNVNSDRLKQLVERCVEPNFAPYKWTLFKARKIGHAYGKYKLLVCIVYGF